MMAHCSSVTSLEYPLPLCDTWPLSCWVHSTVDTFSVPNRRPFPLSLSNGLLAPTFQPPRFVQVNCHSHHYFLQQAANGWRVSGCIDMEVASAGCYLTDLVGFSVEMAAFFPASTQWWQPFFRVSGLEPDFGRSKIFMLGLPEICFRIYGDMNWPGTRQQILSQLL